jgi:hypothetical protein
MLCFISNSGFTSEVQPGQAVTPPVLQTLLCAEQAASALLGSKLHCRCVAGRSQPGLARVMTYTVICTDLGPKYWYLDTGTTVAPRCVTFLFESRHPTLMQVLGESARPYSDVNAPCMLQLHPRSIQKRSKRQLVQPPPFSRPRYSNAAQDWSEHIFTA